MSISPSEIGRLELEEATKRIISGNPKSKLKGNLTEHFDDIIKRYERGDRTVTPAMVTKAQNFKKMVTLFDGREVNMDELTSVLVAKHGLGEELKKPLRELSSLQKTTPDAVFWNGSMYSLSRAANYGLFKEVETLLAEGREMSNVDLYKQLKRRAEDPRFKRMSEKKGQELVTATTKALARAGVLREGGSMPSKLGGSSRVYQHSLYDVPNVDPRRNPVLYVLHSTHENGGWVPVAEMHKPIGVEERKVGNPEAPFDRRSVTNALEKGKEHGLLESKRETVRTQGNLRHELVRVRLTKKGKTAWREHKKTGSNPKILGAAKIKKVVRRK